MRSNKDRKLNLGTAFGLTIMNQFVKKNLDVKIHKLCNLANTEEIQCSVVGSGECHYHYGNIAFPLRNPVLMCAAGFVVNGLNQTVGYCFSGRFSPIYICQFYF